MFNRNSAVILRKAAPIAWRWTLPFSKANLLRLARTLGPSIVALGFAGLSSVAHVQRTMDFSGATTRMTTFKCILRGYPKQILEVKDINQLANS
jgi:hypothetical protein